MKTVYRLLTQLSSRKTISKMTGKVAKSKWSKKLIPHFAKVYQINVEEAEQEFYAYPSLNAFFTRRLKDGSRCIDQAKDKVTSPVDGLITGMGTIEQGSLFHVKGQQYSLQEMLMDEEKEQVYRNGHYIVLYLSPSDYHRIHAPIAGEILAHVPYAGRVYPVNEFGMVHMKRVLSRNERLVTYIQNEYTEVAVVKVGAFNVSSIQLSERLTPEQILKGEELAYFEFGSTVVLLLREDTFQFRAGLQEGDRVQMGEAIGRLLQPDFVRPGLVRLR